MELIAFIVFKLVKMDLEAILDSRYEFSPAARVLPTIIIIGRTTSHVGGSSTPLQAVAIDVIDHLSQKQRTCAPPRKQWIHMERSPWRFLGISID